MTIPTLIAVWLSGWFVIHFTIGAYIRGILSEKKEYYDKRYDRDKVIEFILAPYYHCPLNLIWPAGTVWVVVYGTIFLVYFTFKKVPGVIAGWVKKLSNPLKPIEDFFFNIGKKHNDED